MQRGSRHALLLLPLLVGGFAALFVRNAWISDDAFISFRTLDNLRHGYGLRYNIAERVQAFTHPLWLFVIAAASSLTKEYYYAAVGVGLVASVGAVATVAFRIATTWASATLAIVLLASSKAFVDYTTSGLEDSLTFLLVALFFVLGGGTRARPSHPSLLGLTFGFTLLNRLDLVLLIGAPLVKVIAGSQRRERSQILVWTLLPIVVWEVISLAYYGFLLPNTALAKLGSGLPASALVPHGFNYLWESLNHDPPTLITIAAALALGLLGWVPGAAAVLAGIALYLSYVVWIGGHFMGGRLLAAPFFCAAVVAARTPMRGSRKFWAVLALSLILGVLSPYSPLRSGADYGVPTKPHRPHREVWGGVADERAVYYRETGLLHALSGVRMPTGPRVQRALQDRAVAEKEGPLVRKRADIGIYGFFAGPRVHVVDPPALADPLLSRLHIPLDSNWRIGHYFRALPEGYLESLETGENRILDPDLAAYYEDLRLITRGRLTDPRRWAVIARFNLGLNDGLVRSYENRQANRSP